ncbi:hypothetical protein PR048_000086 [Dryococelus australis]|uniref:Major facilitator superfamily (MFS) profile domain-containing protein n=1 Tax=Dryococelus australis TaxID=614101 RepID=A0ABQ9IDN3_9NEOP|nr:hypothetical protein PR048_000086 [Dryococelus australis]
MGACRTAVVLRSCVNPPPLSACVCVRWLAAGSLGLSSVAATLGAFSLGTVLAWTSPTGTRLAQSSTNPDPSLMTVAEWSWVGSLMNVGATLSVVLVGAVIDRLGRKYTMLALVLPFIAGWFMIAWAGQTVTLYYVGRIVTGMMGGAFSVSAPVYISEIAQKEIRGMLGTCYQLMITSGILFVYLVGGIEGVSVFALTLTCSFVPLLFGAIFVFMPETPRQYLQKGRVEDARKSLRWFRGEHYNIDAELQVSHLLYKLPYPSSHNFPSFSTP